MEWIIVGLGLLIIALVIHSRWQARQTVVRMNPESYLRPHDPSWSQGRDRTLGLKTAVNLRDIGGYPTADGRHVKWGQVYRSGTLNELSTEDVSVLAKLGLTAICDLRSAEEVAASPEDAGRFGAQYHYLPVQINRNSIRQLQAMLFQPSSLNEIMRASYNDVMLESNAELIGNILRQMTDESALPILFHCTAGKDRTGVIAAVLLATLGVPDDIIAADYALSNKFYHRFREYMSVMVLKKVRWFGVSLDALHPFMVADGSMMSDMLVNLRQKYGTIDTYLTTRAGLTAGEVAQLRQNLIEG
jgi:protein-tyrosine phosphatase